MSIKNIKVSIVTVVKNGMPYLEDCIKSYQIQDYKNKELIVVYSNSQDRTYTFLKKQKHITRLIIDKRSKNKFGALNVGLQNTTGDIIGLLHSDDIFASTKVLSNVAKIYQETNFDISYSDIKFCLRNNLLAIRRAWISSNYNFKKMQLGWMPPHVSIFISKKYKNIAYRTCYPISGDYDYILRIFKKASNIVYTNYVSVIMRLGGVSNKFIFKKTKEDLLIAKNHLGNIYIITIFFKNLIKIPQLLKGKFEFKYKYSQYIKENYTPSIFIIDNIKKILQRKKFFLCARNLAFYSLVINKLNVLRKDIIFWQDGMFPFNTHIKKLPGRDLLAKLHPSKKINKIYLLSKKNKKILNM
ncbi:putative glycosyltransferase [Candidatus Pelagibacter sp. IMCC9063]|uniref:glycosyltransferase n=1 Tax=Pelagibacter sp. (strain IMCC9063) TaxID=1002672 RepID=UPI00020463EE|nr:glycosyltransferase [Candidatus Pelagibacter sp. IMCC9063]AEA80509.1 putative glycosyltransferase [Candidatus Pelagibacter sp. IMCC9063]